MIVRDSSVVRRHYIFLLEPLDVRELYIRKTADLPLRLLVGTFPRFVAIGFYFLSETLIYLQVLTGLFLSAGRRPLCSVPSLRRFQFLLRLYINRFTNHFSIHS